MSIFEIGINDTLQDVIRKTNYNFRQISSSRMSATGSSGTDADISGLIEDLENEVRNRISADNQINDTIDGMFDSSGKLSSSIMPSYVDDVIEAYPRSGAAELSSDWLSLTSDGSALEPETGKIYILLSNSTNYQANTQFRWSGSAYVKLTESQTVSIEVGTTTTLSPGSSATVVNSGTSSSPILDFGIPQGIQGPKGDTGNTGQQGPKGDTGGVPDGGTTDQVLAKASNTDQDTEWKTLNYVTLQAVYPVGAIYMSTVATDPATLFGFGTWERITGKFLLGATDNGSSGASQAAGNTGGAASVTLTSAQSGVPAHSHGLNSHKHSVGAHSHGLNSHKHSYDKATGISGGSHSHGLGSGYAQITSSGTNMVFKYKSATAYNVNYAVKGTANGSNSTKVSDATCLAGSTDTSSSHSHSLSHTSTSSGASSGNTANSTAFDSGAATGNTANNTAANASSAHENMPPYLSVYVWKRTA